VSWDVGPFFRCYKESTGLEVAAQASRWLDRGMRDRSPQMPAQRAKSVASTSTSCGEGKERLCEMCSCRGNDIALVFSLFARRLASG